MAPQTATKTHFGQSQQAASTSSSTIASHTKIGTPSLESFTVTAISFSYNTIGEDSVQTPVITSTLLPVYKEVVSSSNSANSLAAGGVAGIAIGSLLLGSLVGALLLLAVTRQQHRRVIRTLRDTWDAEKDSIQASEYLKAQTLLWGHKGHDTAQEMSEETARRDLDLREARDQIRTLEADRNAASAFGDTLDRRSEQEILNSPQFGLITYNQSVHQAVMALAVNVSGQGRPGDMADPAFLAHPYFKVIKAGGAHKAMEQFENIISHVIHSILYRDICERFVVSLSDDHSQALLANLQQIIRTTSPQGIFARWQSLTHRALRYDASDEKASASLVADIQASLEQILIWCGMEEDLISARRSVEKIYNRIQSSVKMLIGLQNALREEMASKDYFICLADPNHLTLSLGMIARDGQHSKAERALLSPKSL